MADGSIIIDTRIDTGGVSKGMNAVKAGMTRISAQVSKMGDSAKSSFQRQITAITDLYQNYEKQERKVSELKSKLEELSKVKIETEEYKKLKDDMKTLEDEFEKIEAKQREWLDMGFSIDSAPLKELDKQMDGIWADIDRLQRKQKEITRRAETDVIKEFVEYARVQGSTHADHYYSNYTRLAYKSVGITDKTTAAGSQLDDLALVEHLITHTLRTGMAAGHNYKDIYQDCKNRLEAMRYIQCTA